METTCDQSQLCDLAKSIINQAKKMGATAAEVATTKDDGFSVNVRKNEVETIEHSKEKRVGITVYFGYRQGSATSSDLSQEAITTMIEKACYIAKFTEEDPCLGLADKELMADNYPDLNLYHPWEIEISQAIELAKECEKIGFAYDKKITNSEGVTVSSSTSSDIYANSHGFCGSVATTRHSISCSFVAENNNEMQRDSYYSLARDFNDLERIKEIATKGAKRTVDRLGAKRITTKECPVIFLAEIASGLIHNFASAIFGTSLYRKTSFLLDHLDKQVFPKHISIIEDPFILKALGSSPFDSEGVKLNKSDVIVDGILKRYFLDSYSARKLKMKTTGNGGGIHNLVLKTGNLDFYELLKKMGTGLLVTEVMGNGINIVTGDYSQGMFGYWIENGEIKYPVTGATIAGNLKDILLGIDEIGTDIDHRDNILTGSILINKIAVAGD